MAAFDYFLQIDGIAGESANAKHKGAIDVLSWSWGESNTGTHASGGGGGAGKVVFQDLHVTTPVSKASPALFLACATGQHFKQAKLSAQRGGGKTPGDFLVWTFSDVLVTGYQTAGTETADSPPLDSVSLNFSKAQISYKAQKADGSLDAAITAGFDVKTNTKV
jgi:type VI secretion system secreted protein Hcp